MYYLWGWVRLKEYSPKFSTLSTKVTVIISARNEQGNLLNILNDLTDQNYHKNLLEIIVVDDFSTDSTASIAKSFYRATIKLIELENYVGSAYINKSNKKTGIATAIKLSSGELIITTDADCRVSNNWVSTLVSYFEETHHHMICGMVNYFYDRSFLGKFQTLDFISLVGIAAASAQNGFYNLCNGANLAYTKYAFTEVNGFEGNAHISSGDDMMLMHKIAKKFPGQISFVKNKNTIVHTHIAENLKTFWNQRVRWASKSAHYQDKRITVILSFVYLFNLLLLINFITGMFDPFYLRVAMWQFTIKILMDTLFSYRVAKYFRRENLLWLFLPMQIAHVIYVLVVGIAGLAGKYIWKGRQIYITK